MKQGTDKRSQPQEPSDDQSGGGSGGESGREKNHKGSPLDAAVDSINESRGADSMQSHSGSASGDGEAGINVEDDASKTKRAKDRGETGSIGAHK